MRVLVRASIPVEPFNQYVRDGSAGARMERILGELKPEAAYFVADGGKRTAYLVVDLAEPSRIPTLAEPFFLNFNAAVDFMPVMLPEQLAKAGLEEIGKRYAK